MIIGASAIKTKYLVLLVIVFLHWSEQFYG